MPQRFNIAPRGNDPVWRTVYTSFELRLLCEQENWEKIREQTTADGRGFKLCPVHKVPAWRHERAGHVWYSHLVRNPDPDRNFWCNGLPVPTEEPDDTNQIDPQQEQQPCAA